MTPERQKALELANTILVDHAAQYPDTTPRQGCMLCELSTSLKNAEADLSRIRADQKHTVWTIEAMAKLLGGEAPDLPRLVDEMRPELVALREEANRLREALKEVSTEADSESYGCNHEDMQDEDSRLCSGDDCKRCFLLAITRKALADPPCSKPGIDEETGCADDGLSRVVVDAIRKHIAAPPHPDCTKPPCAERFESYPFSSDHVWPAHHRYAMPEGNCVHCGYHISEYNARFNAAVQVLSNRGIFPSVPVPAEMLRGASDLEAVAAGIRDMVAGRVTPIEDIDPSFAPPCNTCADPLAPESLTVQPAEPETKMWRVYGSPSMVSRSTPLRSLAEQARVLYGGKLESSIDGGKTWDVETVG